MLQNRPKSVQNRTKIGSNVPKCTKIAENRSKMVPNGPKLVKIDPKSPQRGQIGVFGSFEILLSLFGAFPLCPQQFKKKVFLFLKLKTALKMEQIWNSRKKKFGQIFSSGPRGPSR